MVLDQLMLFIDFASQYLVSQYRTDKIIDFLSSMNPISEQVLGKAIVLIKQAEGYRSEVYEDTEGYQTIGYGNKLLPAQIGLLKIVTKQQAERLMYQSIQSAQKEVQSYWGKSLSKMNSDRIAVLLDMTYNCGKIRWPKLTKAITDCDWEKAALQILDSKYRTQVKVRAFRNAQIIKDGRLYSSKEFKKNGNQWVLQSFLE